MITQIEIDGFKTFKNFKVELAPFQVIVGPNGSGKSNLFDALQLLSHLVEKDLFTFFQGLRGKPNDLFTKYSDGKVSEQIRIAVELLLDRKITDDLSQDIKLDYTRLRYELKIVGKIDKKGLGHFFVDHELLKSISEEEDQWCKKYQLSSENGWLLEPKEQKFFIYTETDDEDPLHSPIIKFDTGSASTDIGKVRASSLKRPLLNGLGTGFFSVPHARAVIKELQSINFFHFNPVVLRKASSVGAPKFLSWDGGNLPTTLLRMKAEDEYILKDIARDLANFSSNVRDIQVETIEARGECEVSIKTTEDTILPTQILSDGTLRILALSVLRNDLQLHGMQCIEEPENGVHPLCLNKIAMMLHEMATDFHDLQQQNEPLRQVLVTTHSPLFISQPAVVNSLLFAYASTQTGGKGSPATSVTEMVPVVTSPLPTDLLPEKKEARRHEIYTINMVKSYLTNNQIDEAVDTLEKAKESLSEDF